MALEFYTHPWSRGRIARWMLEEVGASYETILLDYGPPMKAPEYLALNPMGKVPTIVHDGRVVTETAAICAYLADAFPEAGLAPPPAERASYYRWLFFGAAVVEAAVLAKTFGHEPSEADQRQVGFGTLARVVDTLEGVLGDRPYLAGERFSAADVYVGAVVGWNLGAGTFEARPALVAYAERVTGREAFRRAAALDDAAAA